jgi:FtsP/CotA-like multicopper oxidase with cupredoxin domain
MPVQPKESFTYRFTPPDAGTFFFHPHCNTAEQLGRGLSGILIVDDPDAQFDDDIVCVLKDWRVDNNGKFLPFITPEGAARGGTFGTLRTLNGLASPEIAVPADANIRLRILNVDSTRVSDIGVQGADARVLAIDGNGFDGFVLDTWRLGPAMRMDLSLRTPGAGGKITLVDYFAQEPVTLATLVAGQSGTGRPSPASLARSQVPVPNLDNAESHELKLSASAAPSDYPDLPPIVLPDGRKIDLLDSLCSTTRTLWAIDGKPWPQTGHERLPPPLMTLARGTTVRLQLTNTTPHVHPMHVHGHTFKVLSASKLKRPEHWADTVLVLPEERVEIAFVADNPGNWMIHCHIIEHQDTGMMAWFKVV